jgi:hypothetical protein
MSLGELLASISERRRRSAQQSYEKGAQITRRLQELLADPTPRQEVETPSTNGCSEKRPSVRVTPTAL